MGKEEREKKRMAALGKFNVKLELVWLNGEQETIIAKSWNHMGAFLALDLYEGSLRIINVGAAVRDWVISSTEESTEIIQ